MKDIFTNVPAFKYLLFFISGFLFSLNLNLDIKYISIIGIISMISLVYSLKNPKVDIFYFLSVFVSGLILGNSFQFNSISYPNKIIPDFPGIFKGRVEELVRNDSQSVRCFIQGNIASKIIGEQVSTKIYLTIMKEHSIKLDEGDSIIADIRLKVPQMSQFREDFNERNYAKSNDAQWFGFCSSKKMAIISRAQGFNKFIGNTRKEINFRVNLLFLPDNAGIINALISGNKSGIDTETSQDFSLSGTAHVLAVSGLHIGIISSILIIFLAFIRIRWLKFSTFAILLILYITITGYQPSAIRAGVMSLLIYFTYILERRINLLNALSFGVIGILLFQPSLLFSPGFQMSVGAILGIAIFYPITIEFISKFITSENPIIIFAKQSIALSISVNLIVSPIVAYYFGFYSIISPIANLIIIPIISVATILAIFTIFASYFSVGIAVYYGYSTDFLVNISRNLTKLFADFRYAVLSNESILLITILISLCLIYILLSSNLKIVVFRISVSSILILLTFNINIQSDELRIFPRQHTIVILIPQPDNNSIILVLDRKPKQFPHLDYALFNFIKNKNNCSNLLINGNNGIRLADELKDDLSFKYQFISLYNINKILNNLNLDNKIFQRITF